MKKIAFLFLTALCMLGCQSEKPATETDLVTGISSDTIYLSSGKHHIVPGLRDTTVSVVFAIRHAEKDPKGGDNPLLSDAGRKRAEKLAALMKHVRLDLISSTSTERTKETVQNTAVQNVVPIGYYQPEGQLESIVGLYKGPFKGKKGLVVGHSNTIPGILNGFAGKDDAYKDIPDEEYSLLYVISYRPDGNTEILELHY